MTGERSGKWFVVFTRPGLERMAEGHLLRQGFETYLPRRARRRRHARRADVIVVPLFPRYLFVRIDPARQRWRSVNGTYGVAHIVAFGERPAQLADSIVEEIRNREAEDGLIPIREEALFRHGEAVEITRGALAEQIGLFQCMDDKERVTLLLSLLGRETTVRLPVDAVRASG